MRVITEPHVEATISSMPIRGDASAWRMAMILHVQGIKAGEVLMCSARMHFQNENSYTVNIITELRWSPNNTSNRSGGGYLPLGRAGGVNVTAHGGGGAPDARKYISYNSGSLTIEEDTPELWIKAFVHAKSTQWASGDTIEITPNQCGLEVVRFQPNGEMAA